MKGKIIVIEAGSDASGKTTQTDKIYKRLKKEKILTHKVKFPDYESRSSALVKMYLNGEFGDKPGDVNSYAASSFYAVDRYASYHRRWKQLYEDGNLIIADRYTTSNMVHQASKIEDISERERFLEWLWDLEFNKLQLPAPDLVIFLNMPPKYSKILMAMREDQERDIHESDIEYLSSTYQNACWIAEKYQWIKVDCFTENKVKAVEEIHQDVYQIIKTNILEGSDYLVKRREQ